jgi:hypothetical protein
VAAVFAAWGGAQEVRPNLPPVPRYEAPRATGPIRVDGLLTDAAWAKAPVAELVFPWDRQTGDKQKTQVKLLWDAKNLYVGYECADTDIVALHMNRDDPTYLDDAVEIFLNPNPPQSFYYGLEMNARAVMYDYFFAFPQLLIKRVDFSGYQLATHLRGTLNVRGDPDAGWTLELAIPWWNFAELSDGQAPKAGTVWRMNLNRWDGVEPDRRLSQWSDSGLTSPNPHRPERFGELVFVR